MPHLLDTRTRVDEVTDAVASVICRDGVTALSIRRIAGEARIRPSTLMSHLDSKERILDLTLKRTGEHLLLAIGGSIRRHGVRGFVPDEEDVATVRTWLALGELARNSELLGTVVAYYDDELRDLLLRAGDDRLDAATTDLLLALVRGLWWEMCDRAEAMPPDRARDLVDEACTRLGVRLRDVA